MRSTKPIRLSELQHSLEAALSEYFGQKRRVVHLRRRICSYSSSSPIENLEVELDGRQCLRLLVKDLSPAAMLPTARAVRPLFLYRPEREIQVYRTILRGAGLGTPICYGAMQSEFTECYWLFLERVEGPLLWQLGRLEMWEEAARWLALLHGKYEIPESAVAPAEWHGTLRYDEPSLRNWLARAEVSLRSRNGDDCRQHRHRFDRIANSYDLVIHRLLAMPRTFIHGEFFPSNIIVRRGSLRYPICPVDWELSGIGPGLVDLAALTLGNWTREQKNRLLTAYRQAWQTRQSACPSMAELSEAVSFCQLHLSIQLLGWASDWSPPARHARNWLGEASRLAEAVGI